MFKSPGGMAQWTSNPPEDRNTRVRIPPGLVLENSSVHGSQPGLPDGFFSNQKSQFV
jgi:hypothetical protein